MVPSLWQELRSLVESMPVWARRVAGSALALTAAMFVVSLRVLSARELVPWLLLIALGVWVLVLYLIEVRELRRRVRAAVRGEPDPHPVERTSPWSRPQSLFALEQAVRQARGGDLLSAEMHLQRVDRSDLDGGESRLCDAVRVLGCLYRGEDGRAAQLAPLALPTGDAALDRQLGALMVRAAWRNEARLGAIERALYNAGPTVHDLVLLCRVRQEELAHGEVRLRLAPRLCARVSSAAVEVGDERMATMLLAINESQGVYR